MNARSYGASATISVDAAEAILGAATKLFGDRGFHGASVRQLADESGVSLSNIYNYFPSKTDILLALLREANSNLRRQTGEAIATAGPDVTDRLRSGVQAFVRYYVENREISIVATSEFRYLNGVARSEIVAARDLTQRVFTTLIEEGVAGRRFRTPHPHEATLAMLTMCSSVNVWYRDTGPLDADDIATRYAHLAVALLEGV